jgi:predicted ATPase
LLDLVTQHLGQQRVLLIFDNCEHLLDASARFAHHLLAHCKNISLIATSREPLGLEAEVIWQTPVLTLPDVNHPSTSLSLLADNDAVRLWLERTQLVMPEFELNANNASQVIQLCHALQGIPLAIELAAAQMAAMSLSDLLSSLTLALDFQLSPTPATTQTTFQTRHRTLRAALDWGYQLLSPAEQVFFRRMGVFSGGWTVALAAQVMFDVADGSAPLALPSAAGLTALPLSAADLTRQILEALARKGVIQVRRSAQGLRYAMLDTLRDRARELCQDAGEWGAAQQSHFKALSHWSQKVAPELWQHEQTILAGQLQRDAANIEAALSWASQHLPPERSLAMAVDLARWWVLHSHFSWADRWLTPMLRFCEQEPTAENSPLRANAWLWVSDFAYRRSQAHQAIAAAQNAGALFMALGDLLGQARAQVAQGIGWWLAGDDARAYEQCHAGWQQLQRLRHPPLMQQSTDVVWSLIAANRLAEITRIQKRYTESVRYNQETAVLSHDLGDVRGEAISIGNLGLIAVAQDEWAKGCALLQTSARMFQAVGEKHHFTYALQGIGQACLRAGHYAQAARFYGALDTYSRETGYTLFGPDQLSHQQDLTRLRRSIHGAAFDKAWDEGACLSTEQAQAWVLDFRFELLASSADVSSTTVCSADVTHGE